MGAQCTTPLVQEALEERFDNIETTGLPNLLAKTQESVGKDQKLLELDRSDDSTITDSTTSESGDSLEPAPSSSTHERDSEKSALGRGSEQTSLEDKELAPSASIKGTVAEALRLFQKKDDVVGACSILRKVQAKLGTHADGMAEWREIVNSSPVRQLLVELGKVRDIGHACCSQGEQWACAFKSPKGDQSLHVFVDSKTPSVLQYRLHVGFPVKLTNALAVAAEVELSTNWNSFLVGVPEVLSRTGCTRYVAKSQISLMGGFIKIESLDEIRRYIDEEAGIVTESLESVEADHPMYCKPSRGYKRAQTCVKSVWVACGSTDTMLLQAGKLTMPFACTKSMVSMLAGLVAKHILAGLVKQCMRTKAPGNPWEDALRKDTFGFYARLDRCAQSSASQSRRPTADHVTCSTEDIASFVERCQLKYALSGARRRRCV
jgi:hypothetical protein